MKINKKFLTILFLIMSLFIFTSCSKKNNNGTVNNNSMFFNTNGNESDILKIESDNKENEVLVAFFTGYDEIEKFAYVINDYVIGDMYKINPEIEYTANDYIIDQNSRIHIEQKDNMRPSIKNNMKNIKKYKYIFLGFPIWEDKSPRIILSFLESFNFDEKTIIPFAMSDDYDIDNSINEIRSVLNNQVEVKNGIRLTTNSKLDDVTKFIDDLNIEFKMDNRYIEE